MLAPVGLELSSDNDVNQPKLMPVDNRLVFCPIDLEHHADLGVSSMDR
jgi:hypothetical protein